MGVVRFLSENQFIAGILSGVILTLIGQWISFWVWKKQQGWALKRGVYIDAIELLVRILDLTRQLRSSYLAREGVEKIENLLRTRDPLFIDIDAIAVKAGFLLPDANVVQALVGVVGAQSDVARNVTEMADSAATADEAIKTMVAGLDAQVEICKNSLNELRRCAVKDLGMRIDPLKPLMKHFSEK